MTKLIVLALVIVISGCAAPGRSSAELVGKAVVEYCALPDDRREQFAEHVSAHLGPHRVLVGCDIGL